MRVAIAAVISPQGTLESYTPLLGYLEARLGRPVERIQGATYAETNEILESGLADVAFVCTGAYVKGSVEFGMEILAVPEIDGEAVYYSWVIVPVESQAKDIGDLRGSVFAYTDPLSLTGWMYPNFLLSEMGEEPEDFFASTFFTYSHDQAIHAVADGYADGAAVDSLIYTHLLEREPDLGNKLRIIHASPAFGMPPVVIKPGMQADLREQLTELFLGIADDPAGQAALQALGIDRFIVLDDASYETARNIEMNIPTRLPPP